MKLLLIHAWNAKERSYRGRFAGLFSYPSLTLGAVCSLIPKGVFEKIDVIDEKTQTVDYNREKYDLVLISSDTSSVLTAYRHSRAFRKRGAYVAIGGYHVTAMPEEALKYCDTAIVGPAENSVPKFIRDFQKGCPQKIYKDYNVCSAKFPIPARDKITLKKTLKIPGMIADRGCDNHCKYCSMSVMWKSDPRPIESVIRELKSLRSKIVIFYDPNFFGKRDYAMELMKEIKKLKILWVSNAAADFGMDEELMTAAYESGCRGVLIGLESINSDSLKNAAKRFNKAEKYKEIIDNLHRHGIAVNGCFVLGFDSDTEKELLSLPDQVEYLGLDLCRFAILTPYPGTRFYAEFESSGRLITKDWSRYTQHYAVFQPKNMTPEKLDRIYRKVWKEAYSWRKVLKRTFNSPWKYKPYNFIVLGANIGFKYLGFR